MGQPPPEPIGARIRRLRRAAGFKSREDLAYAIGSPSVTAAVIKNIEAGLVERAGGDLFRNCEIMFLRRAGSISLAGHDASSVTFAG